MVVGCSKEITGYYNEKVKLPESEREKLRDHRKANQDRLKNRLKENDKPLPHSFVKQGSYSMRTMVQHPDNDYDIDDGVKFNKDELINPNKTEMTPQQAKEMVWDTLKDDRFEKQPQILKNCVRVFYEAGHHIDIPVYRTYENPFGKIVCELAGEEWRESDPEEITEWFNKAVIDKSPDDDNGRQMRRIACLLKKWSRSRKTWDMPTGLTFSVLVDEKYVAYEGRDDEALHNVMKAILLRLHDSLRVYLPVNGEDITKGINDPKMIELRDKLGQAVEKLGVLKNKDCSREDALKAWKSVFNDDFFESDKRAKELVASAIMISKSTTVPHVEIRPLKQWRSND
jgi:hypothetical protein